jgi:hypothetical protein
MTLPRGRLRQIARRVRSPGPSGRDRPRGATRVPNLSRASPAARLSASLLPYEIVRKKPVQMMKFDGIVVARRMQHHAVRRRACLFVADIGVAHETRMVIGGSPPVGAVPNQFTAGFAAPRHPWSPVSRGCAPSQTHSWFLNILPPFLGGDNGSLTCGCRSSNRVERHSNYPHSMHMRGTYSVASYLSLPPPPIV